MPAIVESSTQHRRQEIVIRRESQSKFIRQYLPITVSLRHGCRASLNTEGCASRGINLVDHFGRDIFTCRKILGQAWHLRASANRSQASNHRPHQPLAFVFSLCGVPNNRAPCTSLHAAGRSPAHFALPSYVPNAFQRRSSQ